MPWLAPSDDFDADVMAMPVVGIASRLLQHDSGWHCHIHGQLLFTHAGSVRITLPGAISILPPVRVAWIPPGMSHSVCVRSEADYRSIYIDQARIAVPFSAFAIMTMTPLLREVFERICCQAFETDWAQGAASNLLAVCLDELQAAPHEPMLLPVPQDSRLSRLDMETLAQSSDVLANKAGASTRTITRIFRRETGMSHQAWRQSWRLLRAVEMLALNESISRVSSDLGFSSDSAFIAFFRKMTGETPRRYMHKTP